jgi:hypothetical protein
MGLGRDRDHARDLLLAMRKKLLELQKLQTGKSRHLAAADMLLLLAHTESFVRPTDFQHVVSPPIDVTARWVCGGKPQA